MSVILALQWSLTQLLKKASGGMSLWHYEDPMTVSGQGWELSREVGQGNYCPAPPPQRPTHWLSISSQRGAEGHGVEVSVLDTGVWGVVLGRGLG